MVELHQQFLMVFFNITHVSFYIHIYLEFIYDPINPSVTQHSFEQLIDFYQWHIDG